MLYTDPGNLQKSQNIIDIAESQIWKVQNGARLFFSILEMEKQHIKRRDEVKIILFLLIFHPLGFQTRQNNDPSSVNYQSKQNKKYCFGKLALLSQMKFDVFYE